jgi:hypothetical protein
MVWHNPENKAKLFEPYLPPSARKSALDLADYIESSQGPQCKTIEV